ncbi:MAG TPA: hypothetical protein VF472_07355 [Burkholderiaceae bacterium]
MTMPDDNQIAVSAPVATTTPTVGGSASSSSVTGKPAVAQPQPEPEVTLEQFGIELSRRDKRVELLNAFVFAERLAMRFKDTKTNYLTRFDAFADQPA